MQFSQTDMVIVIAMSMAIISMSFVFPAVGLTDNSDSVDENDIPEFTMSSDRFDLIGDFPERPGTPSQGTLVWNNSKSVLEDERRVWLEGDTDGGTELLLRNETGTNNSQLTLNHWPGPDKDTLVLSNPGDVDEINNQTAGWNIIFDFIDRQNTGENNMTLVVEYEIVHQPGDSTWYNRLPVVGGIFSAGEQLAGIVGWIGSILYWSLGTIFEITLNLTGILFDIVTFGFDLVSWLVGTYTSIVSGAEAWAAVFVLIPAIVLFLEFIKVGMIAINLLPTT